MGLIRKFPGHPAGMLIRSCSIREFFTGIIFNDFCIAEMKIESRHLRPVSLPGSDRGWVESTVASSTGIVHLCRGAVCPKADSRRGDAWMKI